MIAIFGDTVDKTFSIKQMRDNFAALLRSLGREAAVRIKRRGKVVAVLLSIENYDRLTARRLDFWTAFSAFRDTVNLDTLDIGPEVFADVRDLSPGRSAPGPERAT